MANNKVIVLDHSANRTVAVPGTTAPTVMYSKSISGGTLGSKNCLRLSLQLSTCSLVRRACPDETEPGEQALSQVALFQGFGDRSSWSFVDTDVDDNEIIYNLIRPGGLYDGDMYKHIGPDEAINIDPDFVNDSNFRTGLSDKPAVSTLTRYWYLEDDVWTLITPTGYLSSGGYLWTMKGDKLYIANGFGNIGGGGLVTIAEYDMTDTTPAPGNNWQAAVDYYWCTAIHAPVGSNYLYAMMYNDTLAKDQIVKFDIATMTIASTFTIPVNTNHETMFAVSDNLIYYTAQNNSTSPLQLWYWDGSSSFANLVDDDIAAFTGWIIWGYYQTFPSFKTMFVKTVGNAQYIYLGTTGQNGNTTLIFKIGPIYCPE